MRWNRTLHVDPLAGDNWSAPGTVSGFARSAPNPVLLRFAEMEAIRSPAARALDLGCGAGRNAVPLTASGWDVLGLDLSWPMPERVRLTAGDRDWTSVPDAASLAGHTEMRGP